jgi:hypothetical protein
MIRREVTPPQMLDTSAWPRDRRLGTQLKRSKLCRNRAAPIVFKVSNEKIYILLVNNRYRKL